MLDGNDACIGCEHRMIGLLFSSNPNAYDVFDWQRQTYQMARFLPCRISPSCAGMASASLTCLLLGDREKTSEHLIPNDRCSPQQGSDGAEGGCPHPDGRGTGGQDALVDRCFQIS